MSEPKTCPDIFHVVVFSYPAGHRLADGKKSLPGHIFAGFYRSFQLEAIKGHSTKKGLLNLGLSEVKNEEHHLQDYQHYAAFSVSRASYEAAKEVDRNYYLLGLNDCVTYVNRVCKKAGLTTPSMIQCILTPIAYFEEIKKNNMPDGTFIPGKRR